MTASISSPHMRYNIAISSPTRLSWLDCAAFLAVLWSLLRLFARRHLSKLIGKPVSTSLPIPSQGAPKVSNTRDICKKMLDNGKNCVIFYGSQTGTAEKLALRIAKEGSSRYGLKTMVADLDDFDYDNLDAFCPRHLAIFLVATYGEGEPTDNAISFNTFITNPDVIFSSGPNAPLAKLNFATFGLGNSTYQHYNVMVKTINRVFTKLGATRLGGVGKGDDGKGTLEEDFLSWKENMWQAVSAKMSLQELEQKFEPAFKVKEENSMTDQSPTVYLGEPNRKHLKSRFHGLVRATPGPFSAQNPYLATISDSRELFSSTDRNCLHMEVDIGQSSLAYETGDHLAAWPMNSDVEVVRFLDVFDLMEKRNTVITIGSNDPTLRVPFPSPTTYETAIRYYLDICAPVSRIFFSALVGLIQNANLKRTLSRLSEDKTAFQESVLGQRLNIAQTIQLFAGADTRVSVPFSLLLENLNKLQPRYYSISSSARTQRTKISITAVVESQKCAETPYTLKGVYTNYLLALHQQRDGTLSQTYQTLGPRQRYEGAKMLVHVRTSKFRLPTDPKAPIVMVGPGTGVAPFRAFVQERAAQHEAGERVGRMVLFFGCRRRTEDFIYENEWKEYKRILGDQFDIITAFSRESADKCYVQHKLAEHAAEVSEIIDAGGYVYVCGDAKYMARDVNAVLCTISSVGESEEERRTGVNYIKQMRAEGRYQEDVWA